MKTVYDRDGAPTFVAEPADRRCLVRAQAIATTITKNEPNKDICKTATLLLEGAHILLKHYALKTKQPDPQKPLSGTEGTADATVKELV